MKKSLLALAVAAALPAVAFAQTNIVLNGSLDMSLESVNADANGGPVNGKSDLRVTNGVWAGSRLAVTGTEELGGGLKGIFNIEHRLSPDTGTVTSGATFWAGQAWVGLQGGFGAIRLGRQYTPLFRAIVPGDTTGYSWYNNSVGLAGTAVRFNNDISYQSPVLGGFTLHAAYAAGEAPATAAGVIDNKLGDTLGVAGVGAFGPVNFGVGFHSIEQAPGVDKRTEAAVSVGAKFGNFGVGLAGAQTDNGAAINNKRKAFFGSLSAGIGAGTVYLTFVKDDQGLNNQDNTGLGLTYSHGLSKRTFMYASVGLNTIDGAPGQQDTKPRSIALGVRHFF